MTIDDDDDDDAINQWQESSDLNRVDIDETKKNKTYQVIIIWAHDEHLACLCEVDVQFLD